MKIDEEMLSAYLDGELTAGDVATLEAALAEDMALQGELALLIEADQMAQEEFAAVTAEPVPDALIAAINGAGSEAEPIAPEPKTPELQPALTPRPEPLPEPLPEPANIPHAPSTSGWAIAAAVVGALMIGGAGGLYFGGVATQQETSTVAAWIADIADYHAVYAAQVRHLVEVPAEEADHIETWLTATLGADVVIPELAEQGLTFEGARLLVAAGRPVAQLLYTDSDGAVVALCQIQADTPQEAARQDAIGGFDLVSWGAGDANFVIVADEGRPDLRDIVEAASGQV